MYQNSICGHFQTRVEEGPCLACVIFKHIHGAAGLALSCADCATLNRSSENDFHKSYDAGASAVIFHVYIFSVDI